MIARGYIRESTERQGEKFGPDAQRAAIRRAAAELGLDLDEARWYVDLVSGTGKVVRDELARAIADARTGELAVLLCYDTSRFARNERLAFAFEDELRRAGARVYYALERIWADDEDQAMPKGIFHVINAEYSRKLARRVRDGIAAKSARGGYHGGMPATYRFSDDKMRLEPTDETRIRLLAWELYASGDYTFASLATEMNRRGHTLRTRGAVRAFTKYTIEEIFKSRVDLEVGGLAPQVFERVRGIMASRASASSKPGLRRHRYTFASLARCGECGERFWGRMQTTRRGRPYAQLYHAPRGCRRGALSEDKLAAAVGEWLSGWRLPPDAKAKVARYLGARREQDPAAPRRKMLEAELARIQKQYQWGHLADRAYLEERDRVTRELEELGPQPIERVPSRDALRLVDQMATIWNDVSEDTRRRFVQELLERVVLTRGGLVELHARGPYRELVFAAMSGGDRRVRPSTAHGADLTISVAGFADWQAFWASEASA